MWNSKKDIRKSSNYVIRVHTYGNELKPAAWTELSLISFSLIFSNNNNTVWFYLPQESPIAIKKIFRLYSLHCKQRAHSHYIRVGDCNQLDNLCFLKRVRTLAKSDYYFHPVCPSVPFSGWNNSVLSGRWSSRKFVIKYFRKKCPRN